MKTNYIKFDEMKGVEHVFFSFQVCVEGNIASGKTSFLNYFDGTPDVEVSI